MLNIDSILRVVICCYLFTITIDDSIYIIGDMSEDEEFIPDIFNHLPMKSTIYLPLPLNIIIIIIE